MVRIDFAMWKVTVPFPSRAATLSVLEVNFWATDLVNYFEGSRKIKETLIYISMTCVVFHGY